MSNEFIPIYQYAKEHSVTVQTVYRWIREHKISPEDLKKEEVKKVYLRINATATPTHGTK